MTNNQINHPDEELVAADDAVIGHAFKWSVVAIVGVGLIVGGIIFIVSRPEEIAPPVEAASIQAKALTATVEPPDVTFTDITAQAGIDFVHENGAYGDKLLPESMGGGVAFFDFDNDGDQDLFFVNSSHWPDQQADAPATSVLYANDGNGKFTDVSETAGLSFSAYGMGVAVGDYDNDGWVDVFVTAVGPNRLFRNVNGTFREVDAGTRGGDTSWSTGAAFFDADNDGDLDLFVCNYVKWSKEIDFQVDFRFAGVGRAYGPPTNFAGTQPYYYVNNGDGTFTEQSKKRGLHVTNPATGGDVAKALAVAPIDVNSDGLMDLLIANDTVQNFLYINQGDGSFVEDGAAYGVAFDRNGSATGAMGVDAGYYRNATDLAFFIGNFANEMSSAYVTQDGRMFTDEAIGEGIGATSRAMLSFGILLVDYDLDSRLDLMQTNGHLEEEINVIQPSQHYEQPTQLFYNAGGESGATFIPVAAEATGDLAKPIVGRGSACADIDGDGDLDVVMTQIDRAPLLLRNDLKEPKNWIRLSLVGATCNRDAIGAWIETIAEGRTIRRQVMPARSYLSSSELPVTIGLGGQADPVTVRLTWPGGATQEAGPLQLNTSHTIRQSP